jgi:hypothetical protein
MTNRIGRGGLLSAVVALVFYLPNSAQSQQAAGLHHVQLGLAMVPPTVEAGGFAAIPIALGYRKEERLDVKVEALKGALAVYQALDAGAIDAVSRWFDRLGGGC